MKKFLAIVVLGLLLSGCSKDKSKMIEACADKEYPKFHRFNITGETLKRKIQQNSYYNIYSECERILKENPVAFKEKYLK
tara:strand:+ start:619 stop:858 length:240 start_codon:yes stop_codon:yes gene_type:complete